MVPSVKSSAVYLFLDATQLWSNAKRELPLSCKFDIPVL